MKKFNITVNGSSYAVEVEEVGGAVASAPAPRAAAPAAAPAPAPAPAPAAPAAPAAKAAGAGEHSIDAPMPGKILKVLVTEGQAVKAGENLMMLEAMKMQNEILSDADATVKAINVAAGQTVKVGDSLIILG
ncbi:MAG: biotin/lipoyl-binding protein [Schwartzia sp.]|nr:biotin/lipoyl-binding protein [Schwartzia sp. (in: firmicutes)]